MSRYFANTLPDLEEGEIDLNFGDALRAALDRITRDQDALSYEPSMYIGNVGIGHAILHVISIPEAAAVLNVDELTNKALELIMNVLLRHASYPYSPKFWSPFVSGAGNDVSLAFYGMLIKNDINNNDRPLRPVTQEYALRAETAIKRKMWKQNEDDVLYGRAGYLLGALILNHAVKTTAIKLSQSPVHAFMAVPLATVLKVVKAILESGREQASARRLDNTPLWWEWHNNAYLGVAHGSMGILYVLLKVPHYILDAIPHSKEWIQAAIDNIMTLECDADGVKSSLGGNFPSKMDSSPHHVKEPLVQWCHGATGAVFLFTEAEKVFGSGKYMQVALRAGESVWERGLLKKGPGLCHGVSGSAYALLKLYKETKDEKWLRRAVQFARFMGSDTFLNEARVPDHPLSLFEGWGGAAYLKLNDEGFLVDEKTGEVINEYGATRFDVATRALRGDFDPPKTVENTERSSGLLLDSLLQWPCIYDFQFVLKTSGSSASPGVLAEEMRRKVSEVCEVEVDEEKCSVKERKGGKYVSVTVPALVRYPVLIQRVFASLEGDDRILMKY